MLDKVRASDISRRSAVRPGGPVGSNGGYCNERRIPPGGPTVRVLIVDDHEIFREGLRLLLQLHNLSVVGEAADGMQAVQLIAAAHPDIILMDVTMPGMSGLTALARIKQIYPSIPILMLSAHSDERYVRMAMAQGASGYILKHAGRDDLLSAIQSVTRGLQYLGEGVEGEASAASVALDLDGDLIASLERLTTRQRQVLQLLAEGHKVKRIATELHISPKTVETHRSQIMERLAIEDSPGLVRFAIRSGLVTSER